LVPDGACLQIGVGALPNLVCLKLRDRNDLGIHTAALNPGVVDLVPAGVVGVVSKPAQTQSLRIRFGDLAIRDFHE
jgi:acyl-CoA hydrolase